MKKAVVLFFLLLLLVSCHRKQPVGVISERDMQAILYDYHLAKAMAFQTDSVEYYKRYYFLEVLKKYHTSESSFENSMLWYSQHTDLLYKIYDKINKQLNRESMALGVITSDSHYYSSLSNVGDTANIWDGRSYFVLSPVGFNNRFTFHINADSTSRPGDTYLWHMVSKFVFAEGQRDAIFNMSVTYANDSVQSVNVPVHGDGEFKCELRTAENVDVKSIQGFVFLKSSYFNRPKLLFVTDPAMIRFHRPASESAPAERTEQSIPDSSGISLPDSQALRPELEKRPMPHLKPIPFRKRRS